MSPKSDEANEMRRSAIAHLASYMVVHYEDSIGHGGAVADACVVMNQQRATIDALRAELAEARGLLRETARTLMAAEAVIEAADFGDKYECAHLAADVDTSAKELRSAIYAITTSPAVDIAEVIAAVTDENERLRAELAEARGRCALADIAAERRRQIEEEGWTPQHDDSIHGPDNLADAGAVYAAGSALYRIRDGEIHTVWPFARYWLKLDKPRRRQLVIAGALIVAEIERLDRATPPPAEPDARGTTGE